MGKAINYLIMLAVLDILFVATGQLCSSGACSFSSIVFNALLDLGSLPFTNFVSNLLGNILSFGSSTTGILSLIAAAVGVTVGSLLTKSDTLLFIPIGATLGIIGSDFIIIFIHLKEFSYLLATLVMAPIVIAYYLVIVDWVRNKD